MKSLKSALVALWKEEEGLTMVEYAIAGALVAGVAAAAFSPLGIAVKTAITNLTTWVGPGTPNGG